MLKMRLSMGGTKKRPVYKLLWLIVGFQETEGL